MNRVQINQNAQGGAVSQVCANHNAVWNGNAVISGNITKHSENMDEITLWHGKQAEAIDIRSLIQNKNVMKGLMIYDGMVLISAIRSLAAENNDIPLGGSVDYKKRDLQRMTDTPFIAACNKIMTVANANNTALLNHNVSAQMLTNFAADIAIFITISPKARAKRSDTVTATANLKIAVINMMTHLKEKLDLNVEMYKSDPFYGAYKVARRILDLGNNGSGIKGTVTEKKTGRVLKGILIEIVELDRKKFSNVRGNYSFKQVANGKYTIRLRGENMITTEYTEVQMVEGKLIDFDMEIEEILVSVPA